MNVSKFAHYSYLLVGLVGGITHVVGRYVDHRSIIAVSGAMVCAALFVLCFKMKLHRFRFGKLAIVFVVSGAYLYLKISFLTLPYVVFMVVLTVGLLMLSGFKRAVRVK